jgi:hypothetical protein
MSFQAYLDNAEKKSGRTPQEIAEKHVGTTGTHSDESSVLRLDGLAAR